MAYEFRTGSKAASIVDAAREAPDATASDLAARFKCSRQYIHMVLKQAGMSAGVVQRVWTQPPLKPKPAKGRPGITLSGITDSTKGSIGELAVAADLMAKGWSVFFPLFRARADLIATDKEGRVVLRFEVRSGRRKSGAVVFNRKNTDVCDHYAVVLDGEPILYKPPLIEPGLNKTP